MLCRSFDLINKESYPNSPLPMHIFFCLTPTVKFSFNIGVGQFPILELLDLFCKKGKVDG